MPVGGRPTGAAGDRLRAASPVCRIDALGYRSGGAGDLTENTRDALGHLPWGIRHYDAGRVSPVNVLVFVLVALIGLGTAGVSGKAGGSAKGAPVTPAVFDATMPSGG